MNKKGFTVIELVVSFTLTAIIAVFLFNLIFSLKDLYTNSVIKTELLNKQTIITQRINKVLSSKKLIALSGCGETKLTFSFDDGTVEKLEIDKANNIIKFGDYTAKLEKNSQFGDIILKTTNVEGVSDDIDDSYLEIKIPITNSLIDEDFGINTIYQYDKEVTSLANIDNNDCIVHEYELLLKGLAETVIFMGEEYEEAGYQLSEDGVITDNPSGVTRTGSVGNEEGEYILTYTYKKNNVTLATATRTVIVIDQIKTFTYNGTTGSDGSAQEFEVKKTGYYKVELWGASGYSDSTAREATGSYTKGIVNLTKNDFLYITVGSKGNASSGGMAGYEPGCGTSCMKGGGGGGGYYGGGGGASANGVVGSGAGGSSFISGHSGCNAIDANGTHTGQPNHYSDKVFTQTEMIAGNASMLNYDNSSTMIGNIGNGYAKITYLGNTSL